VCLSKTCKVLKVTKNRYLDVIDMVCDEATDMSGPNV
jgi:hypothetical protein